MWRQSGGATGSDALYPSSEEEGLMACQYPVPPAAKRGYGSAITHAAFPDLRLRRTRRTGWCRAMVREHHLTPAHLIWPLFAWAGRGADEPVATLPGVPRWPGDPSEES